MNEYRPLIMRSNRFLGSALSERNLVSMEDIETANEKLLEYIKNGEFKNANLLSILINQMEVLEEGKMINAVLEEYGIGLIDLSHYEFPNFFDYHVDPDLCWATFTMPFDRIEDFYFIASAYYLSRPAIKYWEDRMDGKIIWYATSLRSIFDGLGKLGSKEDADKAEDEKQEAPAGQENSDNA